MQPNLGSPKSRKDPSKESVFEGHHLSEPAALNLALQRAFSGKDDLLASIPSIPAVLQSVLNELDQSADSINLLRVADMIGRDEALAAQCLRVANSVLFSRGPAIDSVRGAVRRLGTARTRNIVVSCGVMRIVPSSMGALDPLIFWQHSLACAIVSRKLARAVGFGDPEKAYLAGLLHDIGYIVNLGRPTAGNKGRDGKSSPRGPFPRRGRVFGPRVHSLSERRDPGASVATSRYSRRSDSLSPRPCRCNS